MIPTLPTTRQAQMIDRIVEKEIERDRIIKETFERLPDEQLETIVGNYIPNPIVRVCNRLFRRHATNLFGLRYRSVDLDHEKISDGFYWGFNPTYIPTSDEYKIARDVLAQRRE